MNKVVTCTYVSSLEFSDRILCACFTWNLDIQVIICVISYAASALDFINAAVAYREPVSMKMAMCFLPAVDVGEIGPMVSAEIY